MKQVFRRTDSGAVYEGEVFKRGQTLPTWSQEIRPWAEYTGRKEMRFR